MINSVLCRYHGPLLPPHENTHNFCLGIRLRRNWVIWKEVTFIYNLVGLEAQNSTYSRS